MTINAMPAQTMAQALVPIENSLIRNVGLAILGSLALWVSAKISIPQPGCWLCQVGAGPRSLKN